MHPKIGDRVTINAKVVADDAAEYGDELIVQSVDETAFPWRLKIKPSDIHTHSPKPRPVVGDKVRWGFRENGNSLGTVVYMNAVNVCIDQGCGNLAIIRLESVEVV